MKFLLAATVIGYAILVIFSGVLQADEPGPAYPLHKSVTID